MIHLNSLFDFLLNQVIHVLKFDLHVRCAISVNLFVDLDLGHLAEAAAVSVSLDHMVVVLLVLRPVLVPDEARTASFHACHVHSCLSVRAFLF